MSLNYHHLRLFHAIAREGSLAAAAGRLNLSPSALSTQLKALEARLGHDLFERTGRRLVLTEAGRIALDHADRIFGAGEELLATLSGAARRPLRVGATATLSRNFQMAALRPLLGAGADLELVSGDRAALLEGLRTLALDVVLDIEPPPREAPFVGHAMGAQPVGLHGPPARLDYPTLGACLAAEPVILPTESPIRTGFEALAARLGVAPRVAARVDDMAMVRLLAREGLGLAVAPAVVLEHEIARGLLASAPFDLGITETFHALVARRRFPHPLVADLVARGALG